MKSHTTNCCVRHCSLVAGPQCISRHGLQNLLLPGQLFHLLQLTNTRHNGPHVVCHRAIVSGRFY